MKFDSYSLYAMNVGDFKMDEVDDIVRNIKLINSYDEVLNFINLHFGNIEKERCVEYPDSNKQIAIVLKQDAVEFFAAHKRKQYFSKGWRKNTESKK